MCYQIHLSNLYQFILHGILTFNKMQAPVASIKPLYVILSDEETERILQSATDCAEGECSIDDVSELIAELKEQEKEMQVRLEKIMNMIAHLQHINAKEERKTDEVRAFVKDLLRTFSTDKPLYFPTGFSGDVGDGPTTAYDALPPKKWTAPKE
jgi:DNA mismatch repair ATPase MutL